MATLEAQGTGRFVKIVLTGCTGMLGRPLAELLSAKAEVIGIARKKPAEMPKGISRFIAGDAADPVWAEEMRRINPDWVIHSAAMTDVDGCEQNPDEALRVNAKGAGHWAQICRDLDRPMLFVSTDYVFDGCKQGAYQETDPTHPVSVYGASKLAGETAVLKLAPKALVVRTAWTYGVGGKNFIDQILARAAQNLELRVVDNQVGSPSYTDDVADGINRLMSAFEQRGFSPEACGVYQIVNAGSCSRWELAVKILELAGIRMPVQKINSAEIQRPAKRPANSVLSTERFNRLTGQPLRPWQEALYDYLHKTRRVGACVS